MNELASIRANNSAVSIESVSKSFIHVSSHLLGQLGQLFFYNLQNVFFPTTAMRVEKGGWSRLNKGRILHVCTMHLLTYE